DHVENVLVMTVEPGFGGQSYIHEMNQKIAKLREVIGSREIFLQVDGGVNAATIHEAAGSGADLIVAGSYLFRAEDMAAAVASLREPEGAQS
ncbi:MAG: ribulose-phosphate 3-epimerase, partial [Oscillospiraceae bacterium]|nr:ribulose-phosphate 3-epimerase [Oscillospiraceae bacterium]